jgi:hypothetical protein
MVKKIYASFAMMVVLGIMPWLVWAQASNPPNDPGQTQAPLLSPSELDTLLAPIALYPDPLLAQIFPAASHPDQIAAAYQYVTSKQDPSQIDSQSWDPSVQALAHYPDVLKMMNDKPDWTARLGQAYTAQPSDVFASVQRLRAKAQAAGNLQTTPQQVVSTGNNVITVMPSDPQTIYVPQYSPEVVYTQPAVSVAAPLVSFGVGFALGGWIHNEVNWGGGCVYYHSSGWSSSYSYGWSSSYHSGWSSSYHSSSSESSSSSSSYNRSSSSSSSSGYHRGSSSSSSSGYHRDSDSSSRSGYNRQQHTSGSRSGYHSAQGSNENGHAGPSEAHRGNDRGRANHGRSGHREEHHGGHRGGGHHGGGHHGGGRR